jgi:hypothetical protein
VEQQLIITSLSLFADLGMQHTRANCVSLPVPYHQTFDTMKSNTIMMLEFQADPIAD